MAIKQQLIKQQCYVTCEHCNKPMSLHMAHSKHLEVVITFECDSCNQMMDIIAKTKPPEVNPNALH